MDQVLTDALGLQGMNLTTEETRIHFKGLNNTDLLAKANRLLGKELPNDFLDVQDELALSVLKNDLRPDVAQIAAVEQILESGIPICIASNGLFHITPAKLGTVGLITLLRGRAYNAKDVARHILVSLFRT